MIFFNQVDIITLPFIGNFPFSYRSVQTKRLEFSHKSKSLDVSCKFITFPFINLISRYLSAKNEFKKYDVISQDRIVIIIYAIYTPLLKAAINFRKNKKNVEICLIVLDLPQYMSESKNIIYRFLNHIDLKIQDKFIRNVDSYVVLTDSMVSALKIKNG